jgi:hypothetical protein
MYARSIRMSIGASDLNELPLPTRQLMSAMDFEAAEKVCPRRLPIGQLMREAFSMLA